MITTIDGGAAVHGAADEEFPVPDGFESGARDIDGVRLHTVAGGSGPLVLPPSYAGQDVAAPLHGLAKSVSPAARFDLVAHDIGIWTDPAAAAAAHGGDVRKIASMAAPSDASGREVTA